MFSDFISDFLIVTTKIKKMKLNLEYSMTNRKRKEKII